MLIYDSTNPYDIPASALAVAGYVDGLYAWDINGWARFSTAAKIGISVNPFNGIGDALDVETGDATPGQAPAWVKLRLSQGAPQPWIYVNRANQPATEDAMWAAGIGLGQVGMWIATLDGTQAVPQYRYPIAAVQYANSNLSGGHYDLSITTTYGAALGVLEAPDLTPDEHNALIATTQALIGVPAREPLFQYEFAFRQLLQDVAEIKAKVGAAPAADLSALTAAVARIETALKGA